MDTDIIAGIESEIQTLPVLSGITQKRHIERKHGLCKDSRMHLKPFGCYDQIIGMELIGKWMTINGEGIYGTRPWIVDSEPLNDTAAERQYGDSTVEEEMKDAVNDATSKTIPSEVRFTSRGKNIHAFLCRWDANHVLIKSLAQGRAAIENVTLMGYAKDLRWKQSTEGLEIEIPSCNAVEEIPIKVFKIIQK